MITHRALPPLIGDSTAMHRLRELIARFGPTGLAVLLVGPTGAGKDLVARHIHATSARQGPWVPVNCGLLPREMADSLLFGHRRGSFSGAVESRTGHVERAAGGTLFLDEVASLPDETQVKLLRSLEDGEVQPLGEDVCRHVDLRVVAAMQEDAADRVKSGRFRRDLFRRLAGVVIEVPCLAERADDVLLLARHFAALGGRTLEPTAERAITAYSWPDNVRELRQAIERAACLVANGTVSGSAIAEAIHLGAPRARAAEPAARRLEDLAMLCATHEWDAQRIAAALGVRRTPCSSGYERPVCRYAHCGGSGSPGSPESPADSPGLRVLRRAKRRSKSLQHRPRARDGCWHIACLRGH